MSEDKCRRVVFLGAQKYPQYLVDCHTIPEISSGQILARIRLATICGSDLHTLHGKRNDVTPSVLGHEAVAEIVTNCRHDSDDLRPGDRITFSVTDSCGDCERCKQGLDQKCKTLFKYGHSSLHARTGLNGCYASHIILHEGTRIVKIPDHISDKMAATINCALATMVNAVRALDLKRRAGAVRVLIQGAGLLGIYGCALLHDAGIHKVYCSDLKTERLKTVPLFGAFPLRSGNELDFIKENDLDVVIEVCGSTSVIETGMRLLKPGGTYVLVGLVHPDSKLCITGEMIIRKCLTIKGIHNYSRHDLDKAVAFMSRTCSKYPYDKLVGPSYSLHQFESAVQEATQARFWRIALDPRLS